LLEQKVLEAYADGSPIELIITSFNITHEQVTDILHTYKEQSRFKRTFTDEFKKMISERDINNVARRTIATELGINVNTVKRACEQFGQALKEKASSDNAYTVVDVDNLEVCPSCKSKRVNEIDSMADQINTTGIYCMACGDEHFELNGKFYKVNFEYLSED
jgi:transposase-like protein